MRNCITSTLMFIAAQWNYSVCLSANAPRFFCGIIRTDVYFKDYILCVFHAEV
jgi:hypothetical protein